MSALTRNLVVVSAIHKRSVTCQPRIREEKRIMKKEEQLG